MPEYSSTTITPADSVKTPAMNGSTSGNYELSALKAYILASKGLANGLASLDANGKLPTSQLPDLADDVLVYGSYALLPSPGTAGKLYITADDNKMYRWDDALATPDYVVLSVDLSAYATKAEMEAADTDLKNAITAIDHRVENLEQSKGDYVVNTYKDGSITPSGKGNWAIVEGLRGVSRVENSLITEATKTGSAEGLSYSRVNNHVTVTGTYQRGGDANAYIFSNDVMPETNGHNYLVYVTNPKFSLYIYGATTVGVQNAIVFPATASGQMQLTARATGFSNGATVNESFDVIVCDLSVYFGTTDLSFLGSTNAEKLATIQTNYPHLLLPSEYGTRIVDSSYSGVRAWGVNIWDEVWQAGGLNISTGADDDTRTNRIRSENYIPVSQYKTYYYLDNSETWWAYFYDADKNYIGRNAVNGTTSFYALAGSFFMRFETWNGYGNVYKHDVQISEVLNNTVTTLNTTYHPYMTDTLSLTFQGKSAGSVYDSCEPNVEVGGVAKKRTTQRVKSVVYDGSSDEDWQIYGSVQRFYIQKADIKINSGSTMPNLTCDKLMVTRKDWVDRYDKAVGAEYRSFVLRIDSTITTVEQLRTWLAQNPVTINYELGTPVVTLLDPILDNTLLTEAGGRMSTVQTGTVVDGSFDMGFITL